MDPYLEHPTLWPDVHNRLIASISDELSPRLAPRYYVALGSRAYLLSLDEVVLVGRPDLGVVTPIATKPPAGAGKKTGGAAVLEVEVPVLDSVEETFLEIHQTQTGKLVTVIEILSPGNKLHTEGREDYELKRSQVFSTRTNCVEIDLLRAGAPMPIVGGSPRSDYRILVSRGARRPRAHLYPFSLRDVIPEFPLPLLPRDEELSLDIGKILHELYGHARFDLRLDYQKPPVPPIAPEDEAWARERVAESAPRRSDA